MIDDIISKSSASAADKDKARLYLEFCRKLEENSPANYSWDTASPYGGMIPTGVVEFFKIILDDIREEEFVLSKQIADKYMNLQFTGGDYEDAYYQLQRLTNNEFAADDFKIIIDGDANPYLGYVDFSYKGKNWHYAPDTFEAPFESQLFKFLNYFLASTELSKRRFFHICCTSTMSDGSSENEGIYFITNEQFNLLEKYCFLSRSAGESAFWTKREDVIFRSITKE